VKWLQRGHVVGGVGCEVEIRASPGVLMITPIAIPRAGWAEGAASFHPEGLLDEASVTRFEYEGWEW
jgi:hypothetical protein